MWKTAFSESPSKFTERSTVIQEQRELVAMDGIYEIGSVVFGKWTLVEEIGRGSYGQVFAAERKANGIIEKSAIKIITIPQTQNEIVDMRSRGMNDESVTTYFKGFVDEIVKEFETLSKLSGNTNIVDYRDHQVIEHESEIGWDILIRMELLTPLLDYTAEHPLTQSEVVKLGVDICKALKVCREENIVHRDIKPANIFVSQHGDFKLGDFGIARTIEKTTGGLSRKGTYMYMAPEVYKRQAYGANVDICSLGLVMYRFLNGDRDAFLPAEPATVSASNRDKAVAKRMRGEPLVAPVNADNELAQIVLKACAYDPKDRYRDADQMLQALENCYGTEFPTLPLLTSEPTTEPNPEPAPGPQNEPGKGEDLPDSSANVSDGKGTGADNRSANEVDGLPHPNGTSEHAAEGDGGTVGFYRKSKRRHNEAIESEDPGVTTGFGHKNLKEKKKPKRGLWIGIASVAALAVMVCCVIILLNRDTRKPSETPATGEQAPTEEKADINPVVTTTDVPAVKDLILNVNKLELEEGAKKKLYIVGGAENITWNSDDETVAIVSDYGVVTAIAKGVTTIVARAADGKTTYCAVAVIAKTEDIIPVDSTAAETDEESKEISYEGVDVAPSATLDAVEVRFLTSSVNLRKGPSTSYGVISVVDYATKLDVIACDGSWSFVLVNGKYGWISSDYLSATRPSTTTSHTEATSGSLRR